jgi:hypothetical protein
MIGYGNSAAGDSGVTLGKAGTFEIITHAPGRMTVRTT